MLWHNRIRSLKILVIGFMSISLYMYMPVYAQSLPTTQAVYSDRAQLLSQQNAQIQDRLLEVNLELSDLEKQKNQFESIYTQDNINKNILDKTNLSITTAKSNLESTNIELTDSHQSIRWLEKNIQEINNQLNAIRIFGPKKISKLFHSNDLQLELEYQQKLLGLEKNRFESLQVLQSKEEKILQMQKDQYNQLNILLKSRRMLELRQARAKNELLLQQRQNSWLMRLNVLRQESMRMPRSSAHLEEIENEMFYASENANYYYSQMLIARYADQIRQMRLAITKTSSITLLNEINNQFVSINKQIDRLNNLLKERIDIIQQKKNESKSLNESNKLLVLTNQYQISVKGVENLRQRLIRARALLDKSLKHELSLRQGFPDFNANTWIDLGKEILLIPSLTLQLFKNLSFSTINVAQSMTSWQWLLFTALECFTIFVIYLIDRLLIQALAIQSLANMEEIQTQLNFRRVFLHCVRRNVTPIILFATGFVFLWYFNIPFQQINLLANLMLIWILFRGGAIFARIYLFESTHHRDGHDVRLYQRLKWVFLFGGVATAVSVFIHQLPFIYVIKDLSDRLLLLFLLIASLMLFKSREVILHVILPHIDEARSYVRTAVRLLGTLLPLLFAINSLVGLCGFVNLVFTVSLYESIFVLILIGYLIFRGLFRDGMELLSKLVIQHMNNGWLWTEAFLKPVDALLRIALFLSAWVVLFLLYGWDAHSPIVERLARLLHYQLVTFLNTSITPLNILELLCVISIFYWTARWTREFVYRFLLSRTQDLGIRNSIAILSQYSVIFLGVFISLRVLGIDFRALTVVAGMLAFGVGLGLRDLANNFASGFFILIERPLRVGDIVTINDYEGKVVHIGSRAVTIQTWDHMEVMVPNVEIFNKSFTNWTAKDDIVRTVISIKINRNDNPHQIKELIQQILISHPNILQDPAPEVLLKEMTDALMEVEIRYYVDIRKITSRIGVRSMVLLAIWDAFSKQNIKPPYTQHEIHLRGESIPLELPKSLPFETPKLS